MLLMALVALSLPHPAAAAPGDIDRSFGTGGKVVIDPSTFVTPNQFGGPVSILIGGDDSIYVLGSGGERCGLKICFSLGVKRFDKNGAVDPSYAPIPVVVPPRGPGPDGGGEWFGMDTAGNILLLVGLEDGFEVLRLRPDGSRDPSFGSAGVATVTTGSPVWVGAIRQRPDGRILVSGTTDGGARRGEVFFGQLLENGSPDGSFGTAGVARISVKGLDFEGPSGALSVSDDGALVGIAPWVDLRHSRNVEVLRVDSGGNFQGRFGVGPFPAYIPDGLRETFFEITSILQDQNRIFAVGETDSGSFVTAVRADGSRDPRFGKNGVGFVRGFGVEHGANALRDADGRFVLGGADITKKKMGEFTKQAALSRLLPNGELDRTFAAGMTAPWEKGYFSTAYSIGQQQDGRIVVLGVKSPFCFRSCDGPTVYSLVRYVGGTSQARCQGHTATIVGTERGEKIVGTPRADVIATLGGRDVVRAGRGNDLICGGPGEDQLIGGPGRDRVHQ
jgi:uncharacterized delta-60 repeat protein